MTTKETQKLIDNYKRDHSPMTLPDCMMPDGAEPCKGYQQLRARIAELEAEADRRNQQFLSLNEHIFGLEAEIERLKDQLREPCNDAEFGMKP